MIKLDPKGAKGNELSEIKAHLFIEKTGSATTWIKFRNVMQKINKDFNNRMSLTEFFIFIAKLDWKELVKRNVSYGKEVSCRTLPTEATYSQRTTYCQHTCVYV